MIETNEWKSYERKWIQQQHKSATQKHYAKRQHSNGKFWECRKTEEREREKFKLVWNSFWFRRLPVVMCLMLKTNNLDVFLFIYSVKTFSIWPKNRFLSDYFFVFWKIFNENLVTLFSKYKGLFEKWRWLRSYNALEKFIFSKCDSFECGFLFLFPYEFLFLSLNQFSLDHSAFSLNLLPLFAFSR